MLEVITTSGAVIHVDSSNATHMAMLDVATTAFGGEVFRAETQVEAEPTA